MLLGKLAPLVFAALILVPGITQAQRISDLPAATTLAGPELTAVVQGGVTKRTTVASITSSVTNVCNPVAAFGAVPTATVSEGVVSGADATAAINSCAAVVTNGEKSNVYLPAGTYRVLNVLNIGAGQCLFGDSRGNTTLLVSSDFSPSAPGVISLTGAEQQGPCVRDLTIKFVQSQENTAIRSQFQTLAQGCSVTPGVGDGKGCRYPPAIYITGGANRFKLGNIRIEGGWDGIKNAPGNNAGGFFMENIEVGTLNIGLDIGDSFDSGDVRGFHTFPHGLNGLTGAPYYDGNNVSMRLGRLDGTQFHDVLSFTGKIQITSDFTWGFFFGLQLDHNGAVLEMAGNQFPGLQINGLYATGTAPAASNPKCQLNFTGAGWTTITNLHSVVSGSGDPGTMVCVSAGSVNVVGGMVNPNATTSRVAKVTGGTLAMRGVEIVPNTGAGEWVVPLIEVTAGSLAFQGNRIAGPAASGPVTNIAIALAADSTLHIVSDNNLAGWGFDSPGPLGNYGGGKVGGRFFFNGSLHSWAQESTFQMRSEGGAADQEYMEFLNSTDGIFRGRFVNNAYTQADEWLRVERFSGLYNVKSVAFPSGNLGVGVSVPLSKLSVTGASAAYDGGGVAGIAQLSTGTGLASDEKLQFGVVDGSYSWIQALRPGVAARALVLQPDGGAPSNVFIGKTTDDAGQKLQVSGSTLFSGATDTRNTTAGISSVNSLYFSGYSQLAGSRATLALSGAVSDSVGSFRDTMYVENTDSDVTAYTLSHSNYAGRFAAFGPFTTGVPQETMKNIVAFNAYAQARNSGTALASGVMSGVAAINVDAVQWGEGISDNEFACHNPSAAAGGLGHSKSMACVQSILNNNHTDSDSTHTAYAFLASHVGTKLATATYGASGPGTYITFIDAGSATVTNNGIVMPGSVSGFVGTIINYGAKNGNPAGGAYTDWIGNVGGGQYRWINTGVEVAHIDDDGLTIGAGNVFAVGGAPGVSCSGAPTAGFTSVGGIVTAC